MVFTTLLGLFQSMSWLIRRANFIVRILDNKGWIKVWSERRFVLPKDYFFSCIWMSYFRWTNSRRMSPGVSTSCWFYVDFSLFTTSRIITGVYVRWTIIDVMYLLKKIVTQVQLEILLAQLGNWRTLLNPFKPVVDELANIKNCRALLFFACSFKSRKVWHWQSE